MKKLSLAYASNDKGVLMLGVSLYSLFVSKHADTQYKVYILEDGISPANKRKLLYQYKRGHSRWGHCSAGEMKDAACTPYIIHFSGRPMPISHNYNFHGRLYRRIWLQSPWKDEPMVPGQRLKCWLRRLLYFPTDTLIRLKMMLYRLQYRKRR